MERLTPQVVNKPRSANWHHSPARLAALSARKGGSVSVRDLPFVRPSYGRTTILPTQLPAPLE